MTSSGVMNRFRVKTSANWNSGTSSIRASQPISYKDQAGSNGTAYQDAVSNSNQPFDIPGTQALPIYVQPGTPTITVHTVDKGEYGGDIGPHPTSRGWNHVVFKIDVVIPASLAKLMTLPGQLQLEVTTTVDFDAVEHRGSCDSYKVDVSDFLRRAILTYASTQAVGNAWVAKAIVAGTYIYDATVPSLSVELVTNCYANSVFAGINVAVSGTYYGISTQFKWLYTESSEEQAPPGGWELVSCSKDLDIYLDHNE